MSASSPLHLFEGFGVELEYMIVDADSLNVLPVADEVLRSVAGEYVNDVERGDISWSNELALHVVELKTTDPAPDFDGLAEKFQENVREINERLAPLGGRLMPTAMHPWMDPFREMRLWPHEYSPVYEAFNRIFDCRGHGWANLQSVHLNLPFADDAEFARLHAAVRLLLPILPALAASSPVVEGRLTGLLDSRMDVYRTNSARVPSITGLVVPEAVSSRAAYEEKILQRVYRAIAPHDPGGVLQHEWLNARGAIARFDRNAIEIRVLDVQECPAADVAICAGIAGVLHLLIERFLPEKDQHAVTTEQLHAILLATIRDADEAVIAEPSYLRLFGMRGRPSCTAREMWEHLLGLVGAKSPFLTEHPGAK
ncbi:MAG: glutamate--cysteine ligase [Planctomycetes bacterium]|nr:glutamate--cysteine ligase [Planctomycetota bacterium]